MEVAEDSSLKNAATFSEYMQSNLNSSRDTMRQLNQRAQQAINFYLVILTALMGIGAATMVNVQEAILFWSLITLVLLFISGFGFLTYFWITTFVVQILQEGMLQYFLHKYFRDMDSGNFDKYGLSTTLTFYARAYKKDFSSPARTASDITLLFLAVFSSVSAGATAYSAWRAFRGTENYLLSIIVIGVSLVGMTIVHILARRRLSRYNAEGQAIINTYHLERE